MTFLQRSWSIYDVIVVIWSCFLGSQSHKFQDKLNAVTECYSTVIEKPTAPTLETASTIHGP